MEKQVDVNRIKVLTLKKVRKERSKQWRKNTWGIAASFLLTVTLAGATTYAVAGPTTRGMIQEMLGMKVGEVLLVGETVANRKYRMTVEDFVYDGVMGKATVSISPVSQKAAETFREDNLVNQFGHFSIANSIGELAEYREENKRYFSFSFSHDVANEQMQPLDSLVFAFEGLRDMIRIPLNPTLATETKAIWVPAQGLYGVAYDRLVYSKLGFTLLGEYVAETKDSQNLTIDFMLKNGEQIQLMNHMNYSCAPDTMVPKMEQTEQTNQESYIESVVIDGNKTQVQVVKNPTTVASDRVEGVDFVWEVDEIWYSGSGGSTYRTEDGYYVESQVAFGQAFDWSQVAWMVINGTKIPFE